MKYIVGIPYLNRIDLLQEAIDSIKAYWDNLVLIDNSGRKELATQSLGKDFLIIEPIVPLTFSQSQNAFISIANEKACDFYMYMHNDAVADKETPEKLLELIQQLFETKRNWGAVFTNHDTLAAYNMEAVRNVGQYDPVLPSYFTDCDYYRRIILNGYEMINTDLNVIHQNGGSNTINSDYMVKLSHNETFMLYRRYYLSKWGGDPGRELYTIPFNAQDDIMALLTLMQQEYGPTATLEQVIEYHPHVHLNAQQAIRKYSRVLPWPLEQKSRLHSSQELQEEESVKTNSKSQASTKLV